MSNVLSLDPQQDAAGISVQGPRPYQEDQAVLIGSRYAVFDGVGGMDGGALASSAARKGFCQDAESLDMAIRNAQNAVLEAQHITSSALTTVAAVEVLPNGISYIWAGDSRIYRYQRGHRPLCGLSLITRDHAFGHQIYRCLGIHGKPEAGHLACFPDDILILCSDGLSNALSFEDFHQVLDCFQDQSALEIAQALIHGAWSQLCDNTTVVVVKL